MEFISDNFGWLILIGLVIISVVSSKSENKVASRSTTIKTKPRPITKSATYRAPTIITDDSHRGYAPSKGLSGKEKIIDDKINSGKTMIVRYTKQNGTVSNRTIKPYYVKHENGCMYLVAYCYLREEKRTFRLSRMEIIS